MKVSSANILMSLSTTSTASTLQWDRWSFRGRFDQLRRPKHDALSRRTLLETNPSFTGLSMDQQCVFVRGHSRAGYCVPAIEASRRYRIKPGACNLQRLWANILCKEQTGEMSRMQWRFLQNSKERWENNLHWPDEVEAWKSFDKRQEDCMQDLQRGNSKTHTSNEPRRYSGEVCTTRLQNQRKD